MNLINDPWIPVRRSDGAHELIAPWQLTESENPVLALDAPRPDFNGAHHRHHYFLSRLCGSER